MGRVVINKDRCKQCELCITFCKQECLEVGDELNPSGYYSVRYVNEDNCKGCGLCAEMCPDMVIEAYK